MSDVALIDAGGANLGSVRYALERLGVQARLVRTAEELAGAERVILPGVGAAGYAMARLREQGLVEPLRALQVPLLGVCLGMQLLFEHSEEGEVECLGVLKGVVRHLHAAQGLRIPHMGWNRLIPLAESPLLDGLPAGASAGQTADLLRRSTSGRISSIMPCTASSHKSSTTSKPLPPP